jgi:mRNA interferase RelE/StbE
MRAVVYDPEALRAMKRMPRNLAGRIRGKLMQLADNPAALENNVKR